MRWPLIFLLTMPMVAGPAVAAPGDHWTIAGDNVNLRRGPDTGAEIKRQLSRGQKVVERTQKGDWHHVEVIGTGGLLGWVHASLLVEGRAPSAASIVETPIETPGAVPDLSPEAPVAVRDAFQEKTAREKPAAAPPSVEDLPDEETILEGMLDFVERRDRLPKDPARPRIGHSGREIISPVPIRKPGDQSRVPTELVLASSPEIVGIDVEAMEHFRDSVSYLNARAWSVAGIKLFSEIEPVGGGVVQVKTTRDWFDVPEIGQSSYLNTLVDRWASAKADGTPAGVMLVDPGGDVLMHKTKP